MAERQGVDPEELGDFRKNVITRSLGPDAEVEVDVEGPHPLQPGDQFLICSDGLCNLIPSEEMGAVLTTFPPDEAAKFLVEMANLRGGPDNITCVIVQVPDESGPRRALRTQSPLSKLRAIPWPLLTLAVGLFLAVLAVLLKASGQDEPAVALFAGATLAIVGGIVGVVRMARHDPSETQETTQLSSPLRIHRDKPYIVDEVLTERYTKFEATLREACKSREVAVDWTLHTQTVGEAEVAANKKAWPTAFRARCQAIQLMATPFNKSRQREESFQPNFGK
jgi:protein phosphatase